MRKDLISGLVAMVAFTLIFGLAYPLIVTGVSQVVYPGKADGSLIREGGKVTGSKLIGQDFSEPVIGADGKPETDKSGDPVTQPDPKYFQSRPSATGYSASATFFSNRAPSSASARFFYTAQLKAYLQLNGPDNPGLRNAAVPVDAVTTSASGVDPDISKANARIQANRVAAVRHLPVDQVRRLVDAHTDGRFLGLLGEPGVNVVELNAALDLETR